MKCLVDGPTAQLEKRLGKNGTDDVTSAMHFLSLLSWPHQANELVLKYVINQVTH